MLDNIVRWTPQRVQAWEALRSQGKRQYVVKIGVLRFGGFMFMCMTVFRLLQNMERIKSLLNLSILLLIDAIIWPLAGVLYGLMMWSLMETAYTRYRQQQRKE